MAGVILRNNNICWDPVLLKQVQHYQQDDTVSGLADRNLEVPDSLVSLVEHILVEVLHHQGL